MCPFWVILIAYSSILSINSHGIILSLSPASSAEVALFFPVQIPWKLKRMVDPE